MPTSKPMPAPTASVCLACGDKGETRLLVYCRKCGDAAVHQYCMDIASPNDGDINWWCWDCAPKDNINEQLRKSERISSKRQKVLQTRDFWKERFNQNKRVVQIKNEVNEVGQSASDHQSPIDDIESQLLNERRKDLDSLGEKKSLALIPSHSKEHNESLEINEHTVATESTLSLQGETNIKSLDETQKKGTGKKRRILVLNNSDNSKDEGTTVDLQGLSLLADDRSISPQMLCRQPSLEPDDGASAEPVVDPKWRGLFNLKEEGDETCVEILAHLSTKACSKVCDAVSAIPDMLDIQVLDLGVVWPKTFRVSPPTAASIALYFFPACERDERMYDSLLDEVIERDLALKAVMNNVELLIFSSRQLPLQHWRFNNKYYFWGVFRQKQKRLSHSSTETRQQNSKIENFGHCEPTIRANNKDLIHPESADQLNSSCVHNQSPLSMNSSQASNMLPSKHNTPDSLSFRSFKLNKLDKKVEKNNCLLQTTLQIEEQKLEGKNRASAGDSRHEEEEKISCLVEHEDQYKSSRQFYLRPFPNTDNASAAEVI